MPAPAVSVFVMSGCSACHDYLPRFNRLAAPYKAAGLPIAIHDISRDLRAAAWAEGHGINGTPTTVYFDASGKLKRLVGAANEYDIRRTLDRAARIRR